MPRTRSIPDELIVETALVLMTHLGPDSLTLAEVCNVVGLSPATLLQRFGSKEALKRAALEHAWNQLDDATAKADAELPETPEGAISVIGALWPSADPAPDPAGGLLLLREDLRDPVLRARGTAWFELLAYVLGRRLTTDETRQLPLGRLMVSQWQGAQIVWSFNRDGAAHEVIATQLRDWLATLKA